MPPFHRVMAYELRRCCSRTRTRANILRPAELFLLEAKGHLKRWKNEEQKRVNLKNHRCFGCFGWLVEPFGVRPLVRISRTQLPADVSGLLFHSRLHRYCPLHDVACNYFNDDYPSSSAVVAFLLPLRTLHQEVCFREGEGYVQTQVNSSTCPWYCAGGL